jgi:hypothetical protein
MKLVQGERVSVALDDDLRLDGCHRRLGSGQQGCPFQFVHPQDSFALPALGFPRPLLDLCCLSKGPVGRVPLPMLCIEAPLQHTAKLKISPVKSRQLLGRARPNARQYYASE